LSDRLQLATYVEGGQRVGIAADQLEDVEGCRRASQFQPRRGRGVDGLRLEGVEVASLLSAG